MTTASLVDSLAALLPNDRSGSRSANRFAYQSDWVLCRILELHEAGTTYVVLCDYHEDVVVLTPEENPSEMEFTQVKTDKSGTWSRRRLTYRKRATDGARLQSILGKLYSHRTKFPHGVKALCFASNARFNVKLADGSNSRDESVILLSQLDAGELQKVGAALQNELGLKEAPALDDKVVFRVSPMSSDGHEQYAVGRLAEFLESAFPNRSFQTKTLYRVLIDGITRATNAEGTFSTAEVLISSKGISKTSVTAVLEEAARRVDAGGLWQTVEVQLSGAGLVFGQIRALHRDWELYEVHRMDATNAPVQKLREQLRLSCASVLQDRTVRVMEAVAQVVDAIGDKGPFSENYLRAASLRELYETTAIQEADPEPEEEAP